MWRIKLVQNIKRMTVVQQITNPKWRQQLSKTKESLWFLIIIHHSWISLARLLNREKDNHKSQLLFHRVLSRLNRLKSKHHLRPINKSPCKVMHHKEVRWRVRDKVRILSEITETHIWQMTQAINVCLWSTLMEKGISKMELLRIWRFTVHLNNCYNRVQRTVRLNRPISALRISNPIMNWGHRIAMSLR